MMVAGTLLFILVRILAMPVRKKKCELYGTEEWDETVKLDSNQIQKNEQNKDVTFFANLIFFFPKFKNFINK